MVLNLNAKQKFNLYRLLLLIPTVLCYSFIVAVFIITFFFENKVKDFFVNQINKQLLVEMQVKDIEFSLIKKFPYASIGFHNVDLKERDSKQKSNKSLITADYIFLEFSLFDLFKNNYSIKQLEVKNGKARIVNYKDGTDNYHFWKPSIDTSASKFKFNLKKLKLNNVLIQFSDYGNQQFYGIIAKDIVAKGSFSDEKFELKLSGNTYIQFVKSFNFKFFTNKNAKIDVNFFVDKSTSNYTITQGSLITEKLAFQLSGNVIYRDNKKNVNLIVLGNKIKLKSLIHELPSQYKHYLNNYHIEGDVDFKTQILGSFLGNDFPSVEVKFKIDNADFSPSNESVTLKNINVNARYSMRYIKSKFYDSLFVKKFSASLEQGEINGEMLLSNFNAPNIEGKFYTNIDLSDVQRLLKNDSIKKLSGRIILNCSLNCKLKNTNGLQSADFINGKIYGNSQFQNVNFEMMPYNYNCQNLNGNFQFSNNDIIIDNFSGKISGNDFSLKGYFKNILPFIFTTNAKLLIDADFKSKYIDLETFLTSKNTKNDSLQEFSFPENINFKLNLNIEKLIFKKFVARNIMGSATFIQRQLIANNLKLNAFKGNIDANLDMYENSDGNFLIKSNINIEKSDVREIFYQFENFGQENLKSDNLLGNLSAIVNFAAVMRKDLTLDLSKLYASADLTIEQGELLNYKPMQKLSSFLKLADLNNIKFATLTNRFEIKESKLSFPAMAINSSAINITASGEHNFNNEIDYRLKILLSEILAKRAKAAKKENEEFGIVEDDGLGRTGLYIQITGTVDEPIFKYDAKGVKEKIVVGVIKEKQMLKNVFKEEFKWLKKDTIEINNSRNIYEKNKKEKNDIEDDFKIEWE